MKSHRNFDVFGSPVFRGEGPRIYDRNFINLVTVVAKYGDLGDYKPKTQTILMHEVHALPPPERPGRRLPPPVE